MKISAVTCAPRTTTLFFVIYTLVCSASVTKRCLVDTDDEARKNLEFVVRTSTQSPGSFIAISQRVQLRSLDLGNSDEGRPYFFQSITLEKGDCISLESEEGDNWTVRQWERLKLPRWRTMGLVGSETDFTAFKIKNRKNFRFFPAVLYRAASQTRHYGLVPEAAFNRLSPLPAKEAKAPELKTYLAKNIGDLTVLFVECPRQRDQACTLQINQRGEWIRKNGKTVNLELFGRSKVSEIKKRDYGRITVGADTPQGIYRLLAWMDNGDPRMGAQPQVSIDFCETPVNGGRVAGSDQLVLDRLVPHNHQDDYWIQEFPLAHSMGRCGFRLHASNLNPAADTPIFSVEDRDFNATLGCLNMGEKGMKTLLDLLLELGIFTKEQALVSKRDTLWRTSVQVGKTFVIVKDTD